MPAADPQAFGDWIFDRARDKPEIMGAVEEAAKMADYCTPEGIDDEAGPTRWLTIFAMSVWATAHEAGRAGVAR